MVKHYCDGCGKEIERNFVCDRYKAGMLKNEHSFTAEITISMDKIWNHGDLCLECLKELLLPGNEFKLNKETEIKL